jgi:hypothetical protein
VYVICDDVTADIHVLRRVSGYDIRGLHGGGVHCWSCGLKHHVDK